MDTKTEYLGWSRVGMDEQVPELNAQAVAFGHPTKLSFRSSTE